MLADEALWVLADFAHHVIGRRLNQGTSVQLHWKMRRSRSWQTLLTTRVHNALDNVAGNGCQQALPPATERVGIFR